MTASARSRPTRGREEERAMGLVGGHATATRRAVVEVLVGSDRLLTAQQILEGARRRAPATGLATVYRTLERLEGAEAVKRATFASGQAGYAYCPPEHHDHAICLECGRLQPLSPCLVARTEVPQGFAVSSHTLDFYGLCAACAAARGATATATAAAAAAATRRRPG